MDLAQILAAMTHNEVVDQTPVPPVPRTPASLAWRSMRELLLSGEGHRQILQTCGEVGLTPGMLKMSMQLSADEPRAMGDLARRLHCDASYVTSVVDGLEQAGVAERRPHPSDRRVKTVVLTERGVEVLAHANAALDVAPAAFDVLSPDEQQLLCGMLGRVLDAARAPAGEPGVEPAVDPGVESGAEPAATPSPQVAPATARPATRPENRQPPRKVPSSAR